MTGVEILRDLAGDTCQCGTAKSRNNSFCIHCWRRLPEKLKKGLYRRLGQGYEEGFLAAREYLGLGAQQSLLGEECA